MYHLIDRMRGKVAAVEEGQQIERLCAQHRCQLLSRGQSDGHALLSQGRSFSRANIEYRDKP